MITRLLLFVSSYVPLFAISAVRFPGPGLRATMIVVAAAGVIGLWVVLAGRTRNLAPDPYVLSAVSDEGAGVAAYLSGYVLPLVVVADPTGADLVGYGIFLVLLAVLYTRTALAQVNPLLYVVGYRVFGVRTTSGLHGFLLSRAEPSVGDTVRAVNLTGNFLKVI
jgi:hypothetical protein